MKEVDHFILSLTMDGLLSKTKKLKAIFGVDEVYVMVMFLLQSASGRCPEFALRSTIILVITLYTGTKVSSMCVSNLASREFINRSVVVIL